MKIWTGKKGTRYQYENGDERTIVKFAWLPLNIQNRHGVWYIKWLEPVKIRQQFWDGVWYDGYFIDFF